MLPERFWRELGYLEQVGEELATLGRVHGRDEDGGVPYRGRASVAGRIAASAHGDCGGGGTSKV